MLNILRKLTRSMLVQLVVLSISVFVFIIFFFVWRPLQTMNSNYDPQTYTRNLILQELLRLRTSENGIESSEVIAEAAALNKNLLIYFEAKDKVFKLGDPPKWRDHIDFSHPDLVGTRSGEEAPCRGSLAFASAKFFDEFGTEGIFFRRKCGADSYYAEISGVQIPVSAAGNLIGLFPEPIFWNDVRKPVFTAIGVLTIALLVVCFSLLPVVRISRVAHSIDPDVFDSQLPEKGLPTEILPLVKALNLMLRKLQQAREKQHFFLATSAHEMRTPLAIMRLRLEEIPDDASREDLRSDVRNLSRLVENLLHLLSVRNRGRPDGRVDLVELARDVVADRAPMAIEKSVDVGVETNAESVVIEGDQRLLHVALGNLIDNAVSLSRPGDSVDVVVTADQEILVRDHGPGVPVDNRESIFEPFTKEPPNRRGHGLGLAIVRAIVNLHEGDIRVEETVGGGATFVMKV